MSPDEAEHSTKHSRNVSENSNSRQYSQSNKPVINSTAVNLTGYLNQSELPLPRSTGRSLPVVTAQLTSSNFARNASLQSGPAFSILPDESGATEDTRLFKIPQDDVFADSFDMLQPPSRSSDLQIKKQTVFDSVLNDPENAGGRRIKLAPTTKPGVVSDQPSQCFASDDGMDESPCRNAANPLSEKIKNRDSIHMSKQRMHNKPPIATNTSTPFDAGDSGPPCFNISVISKDSPLSTICESDEISDGDRTVNAPSPRKLAKAGFPVYVRSDLASITDPFADESVEMYWKVMGIPRAHLNKYKVFNTPLPDWQGNAVDQHEISLAHDINFQPGELIDTGRFGQVFRMRDSDDNVYAAKLQSPAHPWEYYCLLVVNDRIRKLNLSFQLTENVQQPRSFYEFSDGGMLASRYYPTCTMLQLQHKLASNHVGLTEPQIIFLLVEFILILENLHKCDIIHADLKPDNIIVKRPNQTPRTKDDFFHTELGFLVLIDFGRAIDLSIFPKNQKFLSTEAASTFKCTQMMEGLPWSYELDVFCMAACIHTLMFGKYLTNMVKDKETGHYRLCETPRRNFNRALWHSFYDTAINSKYTNTLLPNLRD
jgi:hypothetical protein